MFETIRSFFDPPFTADPEQSTAKLAWVVRLRWVALTAQLLSIAPALEFGANSGNRTARFSPARWR